MDELSKVTDDWVSKGCHIHVNGIELNARDVELSFAEVLLNVGLCFVLQTD